jgi:hypothetical protein
LDGLNLQGGLSEKESEKSERVKAFKNEKPVLA